MAKMTLLEIVQNILSAMDSDEVDSISDTVESLQVAMVVKETFDEQFNNINISEFKNLIKLDGISTLASPNYMRVPSDVKDFDWVKYRDPRNDNRFKDVTYLTVEEFLDRVLQISSTGNDVEATVDPTSGVEYYIKTNSAPSFYTIFDNDYIAFDSYDSDYDATLQTSKTLAFGTRSVTFLMEDTFIPPIPENLFPLLLAESKSTAFINYKQISSTKEEQRARRQRIRMQNDQFKSKRQQRRSLETPNYARNR